MRGEREFHPSGVECRYTRHIAYIPEESAELQGLGRVNRSLVQELGSRCSEQLIATVDQDATIIESRKPGGSGWGNGWKPAGCFPCGPEGGSYQRISKLLFVSQEGG